MLHHIQKDILGALADKTTARYSEINIQNIDGNSFTYHTKQLIADKFIAKNADGYYSLTQKGKNYLVHRNENPLLQAHTVFLIVVRNINGKYLMRRRLTQPHLHYFGFIHGEPQGDENLLHTAAKRLYDKTHLRAALTPFSSGLVRYFSHNTLESYSHCVVLLASEVNGDLLTSDETGENSWMTPQEMHVHDTLPSTFDIITAIESNDASFFDYSYHLTS